MDTSMLKELIDRYESATFTVNRIMGAKIRDQLPESITLDQLGILRYIRDRGLCTPSELADFFCVGKSSITAIVKRLADKEFIKRLADEQDRRVTYLALTESGKELVLEVNDKIEGMLTAFMQHFDDQEVRAFIGTFEKLAQMLVEAEGGRSKS